MTESMPTYTTLEAWVAREARPFALDDAGRFDAAVDGVLVREACFANSGDPQATSSPRSCAWGWGSRPRCLCRFSI